MDLQVVASCSKDSLEQMTSPISPTSPPDYVATVILEPSGEPANIKEFFVNSVATIREPSPSEEVQSPQENMKQKANDDSPKGPQAINESHASPLFPFPWRLTHHAKLMHSYLHKPCQLSAKLRIVNGRGRPLIASGGENTKNITYIYKICNNHCMLCSFEFFTTAQYF